LGHKRENERGARADRAAARLNRENPVREDPNPNPNRENPIREGISAEPIRGDPSSALDALMMLAGSAGSLLPVTRESNADSMVVEEGICLYIYEYMYI
jgi:hypothetical protein